MELGVHLPLIGFGEDDALSLDRLRQTVEGARDGGFSALAANDHLVFQAPWLDGPTALASMIERSKGMTLATTVSLPVLRGPVALAKTLAALEVLSAGRLVAALGPGSSQLDYDAAGIRFEERWSRFEEVIGTLRALLAGPAPAGGRHYPIPPEIELLPRPRQGRGVPLWVASWGSAAGLRRVARAGDGWLASAYNTTPERFAAGRALLEQELEARGRSPEGFPNALSTMWTWVTEDRSERDRMLGRVLAPLLGRDPAELGGQVCVGSAEHCAELISRYGDAGCGRIYLWPLRDERRQLELVAAEVIPRVAARLGRSGEDLVRDPPRGLGSG